MIPTRGSARRCHDCGRTGRKTSFPGAHKPYKRIDRCTDCAAYFDRLINRGAVYWRPSMLPRPEAWS